MTDTVRMMVRDSIIQGDLGVFLIRCAHTHMSLHSDSEPSDAMSTALETVIAECAYVRSTIVDAEGDDND